MFFTILLTSCSPTKTHEETVTIKPVQIQTLNEVASGGDLCRGGTAPAQPGPSEMIVGFFHRLDSEDCWLNQIYQGLIRFQIDAAPFNKRLIKSATLSLNNAHAITNPPRSSCIDKMGLTDIQWWALPNTGRIHTSDLRNLRTILPSQPLNIDVTQEVLRWANGTEDNNGLVFIGQRPEMSDFSNTGMLTNESCEAFYNDITLTVTYFQFDNPPHHPSIDVHYVHTQTTSDITVNGTDFTPNSSVSIFADDVPGRNGSMPLGSANTDANGKFQFFNRELCVRQPNSATIRALDTASGDNARGYAAVFCG